MLGDRYEILEALGQGGMGVVYRARDRQLARDIAIKLVADRPTDSFAPRLMREAQALAQLSHPNVVAVYDVGRTPDGESVFVAMELVAGVPGDTWQQVRRPWREALRVYRDAARGLAAAHAAGLVHRDFKPANMIIGDDGRVRVLDFGLARPTVLSSSSGEFSLESTSDDSEDSADVPIETSSPSGSSRQRRGSLLDSPLTKAGHLVGTPQYMSPEQLNRDACDARSDQFSLCVAFYQALYGHRPFAGKNLAELKANIVEQKLRPGPEGNDVPGWLHEVVARGLAVEPERRWASMDAMIEALGRDPDARRKRIILVAAATTLIAGAGVAVWGARRDPAEVCEATGHELAGVWDANRKGAMRATFTKTAKPYAADAFAGVARALDGYTSSWLAMRKDSCLATHVRGTQSAELLDLRMECLQRRLDDVRALTDVLAVADGDLVSRAVEVTGGLPALDACADAEGLRAPVRPPPDRQTRARVDAAFHTISTVRALSLAGRYPEATTRLTSVITEAHALGYRPLEAEVAISEAQLAEHTGDYARAATLYKEAAIAAEAGRDDETAALARISLVWVTGERLGRYAEAQDLARDAAAKIERLGRAENLQLELDRSMGALALAQGNYKEAEQRSRHVLEIRQKLRGPNDYSVAAALGDLGDVTAETGRYDEAIELYQRALGIAERTVGPDHPLCATMRTNLGTTLRSKGKDGEALVQLQKARAIIERALGPKHSQIATVAINIGAIEIDQNELDDAAAQFRDAIEIWTQALGADHPNVGTAQYRLGEVALKRGNIAEATAAFQRTLEIWQAKLGADHPSIGAALSGLGDAAFAEKRTTDALAYYERALAVVEKAMGPTYTELGSTLISIGNCELALGKPRRAIAALERALAIRVEAKEPLDIATARFALARALAGVDRARAQTLATEAQQVFAAAGAAHAREADDAAAWLRSH